MRSLGFLVLALVLLGTAPAGAEFQFQPHAVTFAAGPAMLSDGVGTTFFLASRIDLGTWTDRLVWDAGLHWWQKTETTRFTFFDETTRTEARYRDIALTTGVKYLFPVQSRQWVPFARGGLGLNFVDVDVETTTGSITTSEVSGGDNDLGIYLGGGTSYRHGPGLLVGAEGIFNITDADHFLLGLTVSFPIGSGARATE